MLQNGLLFKNALSSKVKTKPYLNVAFTVPFGFHARIYKNWGALADFRYNFMVMNNFGAGSTTDFRNGALGGRAAVRLALGEVEEVTVDLAKALGAQGAGVRPL